jgi:hypothetical protein
VAYCTTQTVGKLGLALWLLLIGHGYIPFL